MGSFRDKIEGPLEEIEGKGSVYDTPGRGLLAFDKSSGELEELAAKKKPLSCDAEAWANSYGMTIDQVIEKWSTHFNPDGSLKDEIKRLSRRE